MLQHRVDTRPRHQNTGRPPEKDAPGYLQWLRGRRCHLARHAGHVCSGKVRAAHVDHAGGKGIGTKVADRHALPLCDGAHDEQHRVGWPSFEARYRFDAIIVAAQFWQLWPGRIAWERSRS